MKLSLLSTLMMFLFLLPAAGSAAVSHTDLQGITTHSSEYYDLDQNGTPDIGVVWSYEDWADDTSAEASLPFGAPSDNGFAASGALALKLSAGDGIGPSTNFRSDTVMLSRYWDDWDYTYYTWGNWDNMGEEESAFLGFRFLADDNLFHYGWIRARVNPSNQYITLYGIAWETTAGVAIAAGDMGAPVPVPSAVWLLGAGILGLAGRLRRS